MLRKASPPPDESTLEVRRLMVASEGRDIPYPVIVRALELARPLDAEVFVMSIARVWGTSLGFPNPGLKPTKHEWDEQKRIVNEAVDKFQKAGHSAHELALAIRADLVVIGPEAPLVAGLADRLADAGVLCFGPVAAAALIEGSKAFAKEVMAAAGVPTAGFSICDTPAAAHLAIAEADGDVVIKADGLAAGKGVFVCSSVAEANDAVRACLVDRRFGAAGERVLIEERLEGAEVSMLALCDGETVLPLAPARDYKRALDGDRGPNTGGMGCISPVPGLDPSTVDELAATVHRPVIAELARRGIVFPGCLYAA